MPPLWKTKVAANDVTIDNVMLPSCITIKVRYMVTLSVAEPSDVTMRHLRLWYPVALSIYITMK
jgi:hypothetical protein